MRYALGTFAPSGIPDPLTKIRKNGRVKPANLNTKGEAWNTAIAQFADPQKGSTQRGAEMLTKQQLITWLESTGTWKPDKWGHYQKQVTLPSGVTKKYRMKLSSISMRYEVQVHHDGGTYGTPENVWIRLAGGYYKDLHITKANKLGGLS